MSYYESPDEGPGIVEGPDYYWVAIDGGMVEMVYPLSDFPTISDLFLKVPLDLSSEDTTLSICYGFAWCLEGEEDDYESWRFSYTDDNLDDKIAEAEFAHQESIKESLAEERMHDMWMERGLFNG